MFVLIRRHPRWHLCILVVFALGVSSALADGVKTPWVAGVTENSVYAVLEATNNTEDATVYYGTTASYGSTATTESTQDSGSGVGYYVHNMKLTGLSPNTLYHYQVSHGTYTSPDYTFYTAPQAGTSVRWAFGADPRSNPGTHNTISGHLISHAPRMIVYGGDLCHWGAWSEWNSEFFTTNTKAFLAKTPWVNAPGNHEGYGANTKAYTQSPTGDPANGYFSFDYGDAHILVLNTNVAHTPGSAQWNFADADLQASTKKWKIVASHFQAYAGGDDNAGMIDMATQIFKPRGVDLVLSGHRHYYAHNAVNGIEYVVLGSMGAPLYTPSTNGYTVDNEQTYCFGIIDMTPSTLTLTAYRANNTVIEIIEIPEPVTASLLAFGCLALLRRRGRS